jgi:hypothetical protein
MAILEATDFAPDRHSRAAGGRTFAFELLIGINAGFPDINQRFRLNIYEQLPQACKSVP